MLEPFGTLCRMVGIRNDRIPNDKNMLELMTEKTKAQDSGQKLMCPCCKNICKILISKSKRLLFFCHACGLQCFSRLDQSGEWFKQLSKEATKKSKEVKK